MQRSAMLNLVSAVLSLVEEGARREAGEGALHELEARRIGIKPVSELQAVSDQLRHLAEVLGHLAEVEAAASAADGLNDRPQVTPSLVSAVMHANDLRRDYFGEGLFADPAWQMMLALFVARMARVEITHTTLCMLSGVASTTALRWIKVLVERGIAIRHGDPADGRRVKLSLSDDSAGRLHEYFEHALRLSPVLI